MEAKEYLSQARRADRRIGAMLERRRRYMELEALRGPGGGDGLRALEADIDRRIEDYAALVREIEGKIDAVEDQTCREVLRYRYLNGWSWQAISDRTHYSRDWLWRLHARALEAVKMQDNA